MIYTLWNIDIIERQLPKCDVKLRRDAAPDLGWKNGNNRVDCGIQALLPHLASIRVIDAVNGERKRR